MAGETQRRKPEDSLVGKILTLAVEAQVHLYRDNLAAIDVVQDEQIRILREAVGLRPRTEV